MTSGASYAQLARRDRAVVLAAIVLLTGLAWAYTARIALSMGSMDMESMAGAMAMPQAPLWSAVDFVFMLVMWAVMMVAMMLPSATPMILLFTRVMRKRADEGRALMPTALFVAGYLLAWVGFSLVATLVNWGLHLGGQLPEMMGRTSPLIGGVVLLFAGVFQWTPFKDTCLSHCRSPMAFLTAHWREGRLGTLRMGLHHGLYCLGCCWLLMALLFVLGIMNLPWIAALSVFVLLEKVLPRGQLVSRVSGGALAVWGVSLIVLQTGG